jgi:hypothetical protein
MERKRNFILICSCFVIITSINLLVAWHNRYVLPLVIIVEILLFSKHRLHVIKLYLINLAIFLCLYLLIGLFMDDETNRFIIITMVVYAFFLTPMNVIFVFLLSHIKKIKLWFFNLYFFSMECFLSFFATVFVPPVILNHLSWGTKYVVFPSGGYGQRSLTFFMVEEIIPFIIVFFLIFFLNVVYKKMKI